jgi:Cof subfamily protein (haloacid dehalogenase superfamily)
MRRFYDALELDTPMITSGGAEVYKADGSVLFSNPLSPAVTKQVLQLAQEYGVHAQVYVGGELAYRKRNETAEAYERAFGFPGIEIPDLFERDDIVTPKVLLISDPETILALQRAAESRFPQLAVKRSKPAYLEFVQPDVSKGGAMMFVGGYYGFDIKEIVAVGDSEIDISMIEAAGLGVAVANASSEAKAAADRICASNDEAGVSDVIEKMLEGTL